MGVGGILSSKLGKCITSLQDGSFCSEKGKLPLAQNNNAMFQDG